MTSHKEPKPKQKRPWIKPRLHLVDFAVTESGAPRSGSMVWNEGIPSPLGPATAYDPNIS